MIGNTYNFEKMQKLVYFFKKVVIVQRSFFARVYIPWSVFCAIG